MENLTITTWLWGKQYTVDYVQKLQAALIRNVRQEYRFIVFADTRNAPLLRGVGIEPVSIQHEWLTTIKGCFARLHLFDPALQASIGVKPGERIVNLDLDLIVTRSVDYLFDRKEDFVILLGANLSNPCPYNGSVFMLRAGAHQNFWSDFNIDEVANIPQHGFPDDQGWFNYKFPNAAGWWVGEKSGIYAFKKAQWPGDTALPDNASIVCFPGARDPSGWTHVPWVQEHWTC